MVWLIVIGSYLAAMVITGVIIANIDDDFEKDDAPWGMLIFLCAIWPLSMVGYTTYGFFRLPQALRDYRQNRVARKREEELSHERHLTALAEERAKQALAQNQEYQALGLPGLN